MAWQNPSPLSGRVDTPHGLIVRLITVAAFVAVTGVTVAGCGGQMSADLSPTSLVTISGYIYGDAAESGEPLLGDVLVSVQDTEGSPRSGFSDGRGYYSVAVRAGTITITASKEGYETRSASFDVSADTVLNFSLTPR